MQNGEAEQAARDEPSQAKKRKIRSFAAVYAEDTDTETKDEMEKKRLEMRRRKERKRIRRAISRCLREKT